MKKLIKVKAGTSLKDNEESSLDSDVNKREVVESAAENNNGEVEMPFGMENGKLCVNRMEED